MHYLQGAVADRNQDKEYILHLLINICNKIRIAGAYYFGFLVNKVKKFSFMRNKQSLTLSLALLG